MPPEAPRRRYPVRRPPSPSGSSGPPPQRRSRPHHCDRVCGIGRHQSRAVWPAFCLGTVPQRRLAVADGAGTPSGSGPLAVPEPGGRRYKSVGLGREVSMTLAQATGRPFSVSAMRSFSPACNGRWRTPDGGQARPLRPEPGPRTGLQQPSHVLAVRTVARSRRPAERAPPTALSGLLPCPGAGGQLRWWASIRRRSADHRFPLSGRLTQRQPFDRCKHGAGPHPPDPAARRWAGGRRLLPPGRQARGGARHHSGHPLPLRPGQSTPCWPCQRRRQQRRVWPRRSQPAPALVQWCSAKASLPPTSMQPSWSREPAAWAPGSPRRCSR